MSLASTLSTCITTNGLFNENALNVANPLDEARSQDVRQDLKKGIHPHLFLQIIYTRYGLMLKGCFKAAQTELKDAGI